MRVDKFYISDGSMETGLTYITGITETIGVGSTDNEIPTAKAVYNYGGGSSVTYWEAGTAGTNSIKTKGGSNISEGNYAVAEGLQTSAKNEAAHSEGSQTLASGARSHAEGLLTIASGNNTHAEGYSTQAVGLNSHSQNHNTRAGGKQSHAGGWGFDSNFNIIAAGDTSFNHSVRLNNTPDVSGVTANSDFSAILGGTNQSITNADNSAILGGSGNVVSHDRSVILGGTNQTTDAVDTVYAPNLRVSSGTTLGDYSSGNYTKFESDGTMIAYGSATTWTDLTFPLTTTKQGDNNLPDFDQTNVCYLFPENADDEIMYGVGQFPHSIMHGTPLVPHFHWIQESLTQSGVSFTLSYLLSNVGEVEGDWITISGNTTVLDYVSGSTHQITNLPTITTTNAGAPISFSAIIRVKLWRTENDGVTGDVKVTDFDFHFKEDMMGTREEYTKY